MQTTIQSAASPIELSWLAIEQLTKTLHATATQKSWREVLDQAATRHKSLLQHFEKYPIGPENAVFYRASLSKLLDGENKLSELVRDARKSLMAEGATATHQHRAMGAYLHSSSV